MEVIQNNIQTLIAIPTLIISSIFFRFLMVQTGQHWIKSISHTATITLLPLITFVITKVISGNIALSLGMVGALSIVRFRNPVRSPLELSVYFGAITMGIVASVSLKWLMFFYASILAATIVLVINQRFTRLFLNREYFEFSFNEGNNLATLAISSSQNIDEFDLSNLLISKLVEDSLYHYVLASSDFNTLRKIERQITQNNFIIKSQLNK